MADVLNRDEWERKLARLFGNHSMIERRELLKLLGNPPNMANVPFSFWLNSGAVLAKLVEPVMFDVYIQQAFALMEDVSISIEWDIVNQQAADWARRYTRDFARSIEGNTQKGVGEAVASFFEDEMTIGDLEKRISRWYSPARAEMVSVTEVTRAASEGEQQTAAEIMRDNPDIEMIPIWQTENDELVCPICGPRHNKVIDDNVFPPAHPRCRCWVTYEARLRAGI